nr:MULTISPECIES: transglutaminase family protein [unclassified Sulfolobus]
MSRYKVSAEVSFSRPSEVMGKLYMIPYKDNGQKVLYFDVHYPSFCKISINQDRFRNQYLVFNCNPSDDFSININYEVEIYSLSKFENNEENLFLSSSKYVDIDKFKRFNISYSSLNDLLNKVINLVRGSIKYDKNNNSVKSAFGSLIMGSGVCVNYSHVTLGILRALGIPARYVVGIIPFTKEAHAWVEVKVDDVWFPIDPTNGTKGMQYLKWAIGRDDSDVRSKIWYRKSTNFNFSFNWYFR